VNCLENANKSFLLKINKNITKRFTVKKFFSVAGFSERERYAGPSVVCRLPVCLSSVTFVRPTQAVQIFGNISTA